MIVPRDLLDAAQCDERGVPVVGRRREIAVLREAGARDLSLGRIYEGHVNALQLIGRFGTPAQRTEARLDAQAGRLFGVWNAQDDAPVGIVRDGERYRLAGAKTWASGATFVQRPIVTAAWPDGGVQMCVVPMDQVATQIDAAAWRPLGMHDSQSFTVGFEAVALGATALLGAPGDYFRQPWFFGGANRFAAVQTGALERLVRETAGFLRERSRDAESVQTMRLGEMRVSLDTVLLWLDQSADAWSAFDATPLAQAAAHVVHVADCTRVAVERAASDILERSMRAVGARGLLEPLPFAGIVRDLQMYLRQPAPDAAIARLGTSTFEAAKAQRSSASAASTGTEA